MYILFLNKSGPKAKQKINVSQIDPTHGNL